LRGGDRAAQGNGLRARTRDTFLVSTQKRKSTLQTRTLENTGDWEATPAKKID